MKFTDLRLFLLLVLMAVVTMAPGDLIGGFFAGDDPECDCEEDQTFKIVMQKAISLTQGSSASVNADCLKGTVQTNAAWSMGKPKDNMLDSFSVSPSTGITTDIRMKAKTDVFPDKNWDQGNLSVSDSAVLTAREVGGEGHATATLTISVVGTRITWANADGSVRRWYDGIREQIQDIDPFSERTAQRSTIGDGGETETYYLKLNTDGGPNLDDWDIDVELDTVQERSIADNIIPYYHPTATEGSWDKYIEKPKVVKEGGVIKVTFKSLADFPNWSFGRGDASLPFRVVAKRKSDGVTVSQPGNLGLYDKFWTP